MKPNKHCFSIPGSQERDLYALGYERKSMRKHPILSICLILALIFTVISASAAQLWNNGDTDGTTLGWG